jgi:hypothetical protein
VSHIRLITSTIEHRPAAGAKSGKLGPDRGMDGRSVAREFSRSDRPDRPQAIIPLVS